MNLQQGAIPVDADDIRPDQFLLWINKASNDDHIEALVRIISATGNVAIIQKLYPQQGYNMSRDAYNEGDMVSAIPLEELYFFCTLSHVIAEGDVIASTGILFMDRVLPPIATYARLLFQGETKEQAVRVVLTQGVKDDRQPQA